MRIRRRRGSVVFEIQRKDCLQSERFSQYQKTRMRKSIATEKINEINFFLAFEIKVIFFKNYSHPYQYNILLTSNPYEHEQ